SSSCSSRRGRGTRGLRVSYGGAMLEIGKEYGPSSWIEVGQDRIDAFAEATGDRQWIHVDPERAAAGPFGTTIGHGYPTLSLLPAMSYEVVPRQEGGMAVNYGRNKVRFPAPVPSGSRVRGTVRVASVGQAEVQRRESPQRGVRRGGRGAVAAYPCFESSRHHRRKRSVSATRHEREAGAGYFDLVMQAISPDSSTFALKGSTEEAQFA